MVRFDEYDALIRTCQKLFIKRVHFRDGFRWQDYLRTEKKGLIVCNHGPIIGPFVWIMALLPRIIDLGYGHLIYSAIAHPIIANVPIFARMVGFEKKNGKRLRTADYIELFNSDQLNVLSVSPEGEYSLYGNGVDMQPFRSARSIEIAVRANCRIILVVGRGFEHWQKNFSIKDSWRKQLVKKVAKKIPFLDKLDESALEHADQLSISGVFGRIPDFYVSSELFEPELTAESLAEDRTTRDKQLWVEAERMRLQMVRMLEELKAD